MTKERERQTKKQAQQGVLYPFRFGIEGIKIISDKEIKTTVSGITAKKIKSDNIDLYEYKVKFDVLYVGASLFIGDVQNCMIILQSLFADAQICQVVQIDFKFEDMQNVIDKDFRLKRYFIELIANHLKTRHTYDISDLYLNHKNVKAISKNYSVEYQNHDDYKQYNTLVKNRFLISVKKIKQDLHNIDFEKIVTNLYKVIGKALTPSNYKSYSNNINKCILTRYDENKAKIDLAREYKDKIYSTAQLTSLFYQIDKANIMLKENLTRIEKEKLMKNSKAKQMTYRYKNEFEMIDRADITNILYMMKCASDMYFKSI